MTTYRSISAVLLCLMVLLVASSDINMTKFQVISSSLSKKPINVMQSNSTEESNSTRQNDIYSKDNSSEMETESSNYKNQSDVLSQADLQKVANNLIFSYNTKEYKNHIQISTLENQIEILIQDDLLFDKNKTHVKTESIGVLDIIAKELLKYTNLQIEINVHTDNEAINTIQYPNSWLFTAAKAIDIGLYFIEVKTFNAERIHSIGKGGYEPIVKNDTVENKSKNRRIELIVEKINNSSNQ